MSQPDTTPCRVHTRQVTAYHHLLRTVVDALAPAQPELPDRVDVIRTELETLLKRVEDEPEAAPREASLEIERLAAEQA